MSQISRATSAIAVAVSASSGTVRVFQNGEVVLRIEPMRLAMTWREFEAEATPEKERKDKPAKQLPPGAAPPPPEP